MAKVVDGKKRGRPGRWLVDFYDQHGKRRWETFPTKEQALTRQGELEQQVSRKSYIPPDQRPTVKTIAEAWLANKQQRRPATIAGWEAHIYRHIVPRIGDDRIDLIEPTQIERFRDALLKGDEPLSPTTINKVLTTLTAIFDLAVRDYPELVKRNPAKLAERLRSKGSDELAGGDVATNEDPLAIDPSNVPSPEEAGRLISAAEAGLYRTYLLTAVLTGARSEELLALDWRHVDLDGSKAGRINGPKLMIRRIVTWERTKRDNDEGRPNGPRFFPPKTKASLRDVPIPPELAAALETWRKECPTPMPLGFVFPKADGSSMHRKTLRDHGLLPALEGAKLRHFTIHSLRHCFASSLAAAGRPATEIAGLLGHSSPDVTLRVYSHWFPKASSNALAAHVEAVLGKAATATGSSDR